MDPSPTPVSAPAATVAIPVRPAPGIPSAKLGRVLAHPTRWRMLALMAGGEELLLTEITARLGSYTDLVSRHLAMLLKAGLVVSERRQMFKIPPRFCAFPAQRILDFGPCVLRMGQADQPG